MSLLRFDNGALAYVNANQSLPKYDSDFKIYGTEGRIAGHNVTHSNRTGRIEVSSGAGERSWEISTAGAHRKTLSDFSTAVIENLDPSPGGLDGLRNVELVAALCSSDADYRIERLGGGAR